MRLSSLIHRLAVLILIVFLMVGCGSGRTDNEKDYLLKIGDLTVTRTDYEEALEIAKAAYPYEALQDKDTLEGIQRRLLKQLTEELLISRRAQEMGLSISEAELGVAINAIKADYPEGEFENTLFENAVSFQVWKKRLAARLLVEKVIRKELMEKVDVTTEAVQEYYAQHPQDTVDMDQADRQHNIMVVKRLRRAEARQRYPEWIKQLQNNYRVELNTQMWERLLKLK